MKAILFLLIAVSFLAFGVSSSWTTQPASHISNYIGAPTETQTALPSAPPLVVEFTPTPAPIPLPNDILKPKLEAFIRVPSGSVPKPFVILSGYQSYASNSGPITISGLVQDRSFFCPASPCALEFPESGQITFRAHNASGDASDEVQADILVSRLEDGYSVTIASLGKFVIFSDSCANIWQNAESPPPTWARFPQDPGELNTEKSLQYLAGRLLLAGVANAKDCPGGGWDSNAPNGCGLARTKSQMISWQNQYDLNIWLVGRDQHIPPIILKTLLEIESQFWPISQRLFLDELGLGQINQLGIDVLLRTNPGLYVQVCTGALYRCDQPYESLSGIDRALIRGTLAQSLDASCSTCLYGLDLTKASQSIPLIAKVLYANCVQTRAILKLHNLTANYEDSWKLTLVSYHSGFGCLQSAIDKSAEAGTQITWKTVSANLVCQGAVAYIEKFWAALQTFNKNLEKQVELTSIQLQNPTPVPTLPVVSSNARILVKIFVDQNGDGIQQSDEALDNVQVNLDLENGVSLTRLSANGVAVFELSKISVGVRGKISLPGLYRSASVLVPDSGDISVIFVFTKPVLPTRLP
jgi:hypothetical protein